MSKSVATILVSVGLLAGSLSAVGRADDDSPTGRKLAVVVGVNAYRANSDLPALKHAVQDATALSETLRQQGFTVYEMTHAVAKQDGQETMSPNLAYIRDAIDGILGYPNLGPDDAILITLHGHGVQYEFTDAAGTKTPRFYFCPADATVAGLKTAADVTDRHNLLPLDELYQQLGACTAATKLLIVDACRNDPTQPGLFRESLASATLPKLPAPPGGTAAFFSCKANQRAVEDPELEQGVFTHFLVQGLQGAADQPLANRPADGIITFAELSAYVANNTYAHVYDRYKVKQSPELRGDYDLNLPLARVAAVQSLEGQQAGDVRTFTDLGVKFHWCPAGSFTMGSPASETDRSTDEEQISVMFSRGFWLGQTEVTQGLWQSVMGTTPWAGEKYVQTGANYPAVSISHGLDSDSTQADSATLFCSKLTARERAAGRLPSGWSYQLPTEAQWEYACRAGTTTPYNGDGSDVLSDLAWYDENAFLIIGEKYAHLVGQKKANRWGLLDMHGNVWEWCQDWYGEKLPGGRDPLVSSGGSYRVYRGGCWFYSAGICRSADRDWNDPSYWSDHLGFRLCLSQSAE